MAHMVNIHVTRERRVHHHGVIRLGRGGGHKVATHQTKPFRLQYLAQVASQLHRIDLGPGSARRLGQHAMSGGRLQHRHARLNPGQRHQIGGVTFRGREEVDKGITVTDQLALERDHLLGQGVARHGLLFQPGLQAGQLTQGGAQLGMIGNAHSLQAAVAANLLLDRLGVVVADPAGVGFEFGDKLRIGNGNRLAVTIDRRIDQRHDLGPGLLEAACPLHLGCHIFEVAGEVIHAGHLRPFCHHLRGGLGRPTFPAILGALNHPLTGQRLAASWRQIPQAAA